MLVPNLFVFFLHVTTFIAISGFAHIVFIKLREVSPGVEVVPIFIEFVNLLNGHGSITDVWYWLLLGKESITKEDLIEEFIKSLF